MESQSYRIVVLWWVVMSGDRCLVSVGPRSVSRWWRVVVRGDYWWPLIADEWWLVVMSGGQWGEWLSVRVSAGRYGLVVIVGGEWWLVASRLVVTRIRSGHLSVVTSIIIFVCLTWVLSAVVWMLSSRHLGKVGDKVWPVTWAKNSNQLVSPPKKASMSVSPIDV